MKRHAIPVVAFALLLLPGCVAYVEPPVAYEPGPAVVVAPVLPPVVILKERPYHVHSGYHYYWDDGRRVWLYSTSKRGPWYQLPRSHYPQRFQYRDKWHDRDGDRDGDEDRGRGREKRREKD